MSTLDDFFGDSETAEKECLYCGKADGELSPATYDANGVVLWEHKDCKREADEKEQKATDARKARWAAHEAYYKSDSK